MGHGRRGELRVRVHVDRGVLREAPPLARTIGPVVVSDLLRPIEGNPLRQDAPLRPLGRRGRTSRPHGLLVDPDDVVGLTHRTVGLLHGCNPLKMGSRISRVRESVIKINLSDTESYVN